EVPQRVVHEAHVGAVGHHRVQEVAGAVVQVVVGVAGRVRRGQGQAVLVGLHGRGRARGVGDGVAGGRKVGVAEAARVVVALLVSQPSQGVVGEKGVDAARVGDRLQGVQLQRVTRVRDVGVRDRAVLAGGAQQVGTGRVVAVGDLLAGGGGGRGDL